MEPNTNNQSTTPARIPTVRSLTPRMVAQTKRFDGLADRFQSALQWIDFNLLPVIAWPVLLGFAAVGIYTFLGGLNHDWKIGVSIAIAAFIGFKAHK